MLKKIILSTVAIGLVFSSVLPTYAYASAPAIVQHQEEVLKKFGKVIEVNNDNIVIEIPKEVDAADQLIMDQLVLKLNNTKITNINGKETTSIKLGTYVLANHSPIMTRSLPAQTNASEIVVNFPVQSNKVISIGKLIEKNDNSSKFETSMPDIKLNFTEDSSIYNVFGDKVELSEVEEGSKLLVWNEFNNGELKNIENGVCNVSMAFIVPKSDSNTVKLENIQGIGFAFPADENSLYVVSPRFINEDEGFIFSDIVLHTANAKILDVMGNDISINDIKEDTVIKYTHSPAMTMSLPPQSNASEIQLAEKVACYVKLGKLIESTGATSLFYQEDTDDPQDKILFNRESELFKGIGNEKIDINDLKEGQTFIAILDYHLDKSRNIELISKDKVYTAIYAYLLPEVDSEGNIIEDDDTVDQIQISRSVIDVPELIIDPIVGDRIFVKIAGDDNWARIVVANGDIYIERDELDTIFISDVKAVRTADGKLMLPIRHIVREFGFDVIWNDETKSVSLLKGNSFDKIGPNYENVNVSKMTELVSFSSNSKEYTAFGDIKSLSNSIAIINDRAYAPIEFFETIFEANVILMQE